MSDAEADETPVLTVAIDHPIGSISIALSFEAKKGITVLFGPSGAGKTTTLLTIAGLVQPKHGKIKLQNDVWLDTDARVSRAVHKRKVAFVFQSQALFPHLTAIANVTYGMDAALDHATKNSRAEKLLQEWRVPHLADRKPRTFSGGEAQRVALARAFATSPRVVLMDEPFSALDEALRRELAADVKAHIAKLSVPALFVTHSAREAEALGDHVIMLEKGRIVRQGAARETLATPAE